MNEQDSLSPDSAQAGEYHVGQTSDLPAVRNITGLAIVRCARLLYGIDVKWVREIRPFTRATPVYGPPAFWVGVTALHGHLHAVLNLQQFLFPQQTSAENQQQIVFTAVNNLSIGLLVEEILAVRQVDAQTITAVSAPETPYVLGVTSDQITVLDLPVLFADPRLTVQASQASDAEV